MVVDKKIQILIYSISILFLFALIYKERNPVECSIDPVLDRLKSDMVKLDPRTAKLQFFPGGESYTEDKKKIFICLKDEHGQYYPYNQLMNVAIHEVSHAMCPIVDESHVSQEWNTLFRSNLKKAADIGLYNPNEPLIQNYCRRSGA